VGTSGVSGWLRVGYGSNCLLSDTSPPSVAIRPAQIFSKFLETTLEFGAPKR